ncbi:MAG: branched-chain amino acid aminotransferase [Gammaproteobacteria bacterium]|jgi:branched-chain amino acid aminotransferase|nr:branched-chain amino acid aminotransferase [Gammaproteobacteria bacterium]MDP6166783.1 branched-chain amino acid aminotransferase [Gammaproteobacteria bacterium]
MTAFGTVFTDEMTISWYDGTAWDAHKFVPSHSLNIHPAAHVLHYSSTCFEGLKAFRHPDGSIKLFRMDQNIERFAQSSSILHLPAIDITHTRQMIIDAVTKYADQVPEPPGSLYVRPTHMGTEPAVGKAAAPSNTSVQYILLSPVGDYFSGGGEVALRVLLDAEGMRCAPHMGMVKSGGNYASALDPIMRAKAELNAAQVLFCPDGDVQETGAANFILIDGNEVITKALDETFLHGVTRDSILTLAKDRGMNVQERNLSVDELLERAAKPGCEAALSGTAAVLTSVGTLIYKGQEYQVGSGRPGQVTQALRKALNDIQWGLADDKHNWLTNI